jgi:hypothetical protein
VTASATATKPRIAHGADGAGLARRLYRKSPIRWLHNIWWDHRGLRDADVMVCSYPRSGSTWLRFLLFGMTAGVRGSFSNVGKDIPYVGNHANADPLVPGGGRLIKTHEPYRHSYRKLIHLVRDPRDVAISYWSFMQRIGKVVVTPADDVAASFDHFIDAFIAGRIDAFSTWDRHVGSYLAAAERHPGEIHLVRFEDLRSDTPRNLRAIAEFLGLEASAERASFALDQASLESMRRAEDEAVASERSTFANASRRTGIRAVDSGEVGRWRSQLTEEQNRKFEVFGDEMERMGYPQS